MALPSLKMVAMRTAALNFSVTMSRRTTPVARGGLYLIVCGSVAKADLDRFAHGRETRAHARVHAALFLLSMRYASIARAARLPAAIACTTLVPPPA